MEFSKKNVIYYCRDISNNKSTLLSLQDMESESEGLGHHFLSRDRD